jgi:uncharacterized membrane protein YesL
MWVLAVMGCILLVNLAILADLQAKLLLVVKGFS